MRNSHSSNDHHSPKHVEQAEHRILDHLSKHHPLTEVYKELHQLRDHDAKHGRNFHKDLEHVNRLLHKDLAKMHLPSLTIEEHGRTFKVKPDGQTVHTRGTERDLPVPVRQALRAESKHYHEHGKHSAGQARFVPPRELPRDYPSTPDSRAIGRDGFRGGGGAADAGGPVDAMPSGRGVEAGAKSPSQTGFAEKLLQRLNLPVTPENLKFLDAWQRAEGGSADNPFNTTQSMPGATRFNSVGVKRYPSIDVGVEATAKTLANGYYEPILAALRHGQNAHSAALAVGRTPWGTHNGVAKLV